MNDKLVTVATFNESIEAQMAKNLLESEGIEALTSGDLAATAFFANRGLNKVLLQVRSEDAQRATGFLATVDAARLNADWENEAEAGTWLCSICGEPISNGLSMCYACQTPRDAIRAAAPRDRQAIQATHDEIQQRDEDSPPSAQTLASGKVPKVEEAEPPSSPLDEVARRAFRAAILGTLLITVFVLPLSWYYLAKVFFSDDDLSPKGKRYLYGALAVNGFVLSVLFLIFLANYRAS